MSDNNSYQVFSGTKTRYLAEKICASLGRPLGNLNITKFSDGEFAVSYEESIRGKDVFLVQSTFPNSDNLMELLLMIDAAKRASARHIIAVIPYFGWARQDRKDKPRVSIGAKLVADMLSAAGIDRLITMDASCRPDSGILRCSCRPSLCQRCHSAIPAESAHQGSRHRITGRWRRKACRHLRQVSQLPTRTVQ